MNEYEEAEYEEAEEKAHLFEKAATLLGQANLSPEDMVALLKDCANTIGDLPFEADPPPKEGECWGVIDCVRMVDILEKRLAGSEWRTSLRKGSPMILVTQKKKER
jgi:hypothetical protein